MKAAPPIAVDEVADAQRLLEGPCIAAAAEMVNRHGVLNLDDRFITLLVGLITHVEHAAVDRAEELVRQLIKSKDPSVRERALELDEAKNESQTTYAAVGYCLGLAVGRRVGPLPSAAGPPEGRI